ncbi:MAG: magnesium transporter CorA family protein [Selenomonadaceae bacterium]|nr:magnesium transporter CorA family protein [Selenomonadaceae bacterium]
MLNIFYSDNDGALQELTLDTLKTGAWISITDPTPYELKLVGEVTEVEPDFLRSALDDEERSHTDVEDNAVLVLTNVPVVRDGEYDALPLGVILTEDYIITVCLEETPVMAEFNVRTAKLFRTFKRTRFLFQILYKSVTYYLKYLRQISRQSEEIEDRLRVSMKNKDILRLLELQKGLTYFNAALRSDGVVLDKLLRHRTNHGSTNIIRIYEEDEELLEDVIIENKQAREMVEMYGKILARQADTFSSIISNNQNSVMKFLAAITIIIAIPTVIASFFGMNVPIPFGENQNGFLYIMLIAVSGSGALAYAFWRRNMF